LRALASSPRLVARGAGGTLELFDAFAARGATLTRASAERIGAEARNAETERHGCRGCPTPCGWEFRRSDGSSGGAHFSALLPLGPALGLEGFGSAHELVALCDRLGLDAKEAGAALAVLMRARREGRAPGPPLEGDARALGVLIEECVSGTGPGACLAQGARALATELGLAAGFAGTAVLQGEGARRDGDLAALLGQCVAVRGAEPLRSFPFLVSDGVPHERTAALLAPLPVPAGAHDARSPVGKGRLVWWHENFVSAVDATGFCAFSAAAVLSDGLLNLDALAGEILPEAWRDGAEHGGDGERLLAAGAQLVDLFHAGNARLGAPVAALPPWAEVELAREGMLDEYESLRAAAAAQPESLFAGALAAISGKEAIIREAFTESSTRREAGSIRLQGTGLLSEVLGAGAELDLPLPASLMDAFKAAAERWPRARSWIGRDGAPIPAVYRDGVALGTRDEIRAGDVLDLVIAVSGG
jgi:aldehyde:ferredoxin oxidoreductase